MVFYLFSDEFFRKYTVFGGFLATIIIFVAIKKIAKQKISRKFGSQCYKPPSLFPWDPIGLVSGMQIALTFNRRQILPWTQYLFTHYNGTFACRILFQEYMWTCHPRNIKHLLATQFSDFTAAGERTHLFAKFSTKGVLTLDGQAWTIAKEQLRRPFSLSGKRFAGEFDMWERHFQRYLIALPAEGVEVDLQQLMPSLVMDILSEFALGDSFDALSKDQTKEKREVSNALMLVKDCIARKGFAGPFHWAVGGAKFTTACNTFRRYLQKSAHQSLVQAAERKSNENLDTVTSFIETLALEEKDELVLRDQVSNVLLAGVDATAALICAAIWLLARNERVSAQLRRDIEHICGSALPTSSMIKNMPYIRYVITLRLFPPVTFDMRTAKKDTTLPVGGGLSGKSPIMIKRGQNVVFSTYSAHRWTDTYGSDSDQFHPERWENMKANTPGFLPFHIGPRSCPGQQYASAVASYVITRMFQNFGRIEAMDEGAWVENISMTLGNQRGVVVSLFRE